jgi:hypothetical protein
MTLKFDGNGSGVIKIPSTPQLQLTKFSLVCWFKTTKNYIPDPQLGGEGMMITKGGWIGNIKGQQLSYGIWCSDANHLRAGFETTAGADNILTTSGTTINNGQWRHGAITYDGVKLKLYLDGKLFKEMNTNAQPELNNIPLVIGKNPMDNRKGYFQGELSDIRVYNKAISDSTISSIYNLNSGIVYSNNS